MIPKMGSDYSNEQVIALLYEALDIVRHGLRSDGNHDDFFTWCFLLYIIDNHKHTSNIIVEANNLTKIIERYNANWGEVDFAKRIIFILPLEYAGVVFTNLRLYIAYLHDAYKNNDRDDVPHVLMHFVNSLMLHSKV